MSENIEIRNIEGQDVFIGKITDGLYLYNDVFVYSCPERVITDEDILHFLDAKNDPFFPYAGSDKGEIIAITKLDDGSFMSCKSDISSFDDGKFEACARSTLDEYKTWAGV